MTPIRYTYLVFLLCLFSGIHTAQAQCSASAVAANLSCFGLANGSVDLTASNGTAPYTYAWSNNQATEDLSNLAAGTYTCTVTDNLGCTTTASATVTEPPPLSVTVGGNNVLNCATINVTIAANVVGGTSPYTYNWSFGETTEFSVFTSPGNYGLTVTDQNGCTAAANVLVLEDVSIPVACIAAPQTLTCSVQSIQLDASCSIQGPIYTWTWVTTGGNIIGGNSTLSPTIDASGTYTLFVTNVQNGCTDSETITVNQDVTPPIANAGPNQAVPCGGGTVILQGEVLNGGGFQYSWTTVNGNIISGANTATPVVDESGIYVFTVTNPTNGCTSTSSTIVTSSGTGLCSSILGMVLQDTVENCLGDAGEPPLQGWIIKAEGTFGEYFAVTDLDGHYEVFVDPGDTYSVSAVAPSFLWIACPAIPDIVVTNNNETWTANDLLFQKLAGCPMLTVDISSGNLRRCFSNNNFGVSYCNMGTEAAEQAFVIITLDPLLSIVSANHPYTNLGSGVLRFELGDLAIGTCGSFSFQALLSCDAVLGQTHCTEAHIYPDDPCIPPDIQWSGASLRISSQCQTDSVRFTIENIGTGNMPNALDYIVVEDQVMLMTAPVQLDAGESTTISVPANGSTWRLEVEQEPFHPGQSRPAVSVEGCTTAPSFSTGFVTIFPADDADEFIDINCRENTGSYDPNDKQGYPKGYGAAHYIRPGTPLEYQIRFQNTGNDTAFTVRIVDTLSAWLDPSTIRPGASSHPYTWDLSGAGVLSFLFENILLPDSNVNEPASHGFFKFTVDHKAGAPLETVLENTAEIYFDFNEAIVTNTTFHRLGENFVTVGLWQPEQPEYAVLVSPNPFSDAAVLEVKGLHQNTPLHLQVIDLQGKLQVEMDSNNSIFQLNKGSLPTGVYLFNISQAGKIVGTGKLIVQD